MGCCFGKQQQQAPNAPPPPSPHPPEKLPVPASDPCPADDRSCVPASAVEEETVKEVLSETSKPSFLKPEEEEEKLEKKDAVLINGCDEISEISDLCSLSESVSTTTMTEKRCEGDDGEVEMRARENRSPAKFRRKRSAPGEFSGRRERGGKSPARRSEPSPGRRTPGREAGQTNRGRSSAGSNGFRRDVGENSGRRSRSPATRAERNAAPRNDLGRSPSARKTGWSPGKMPAGLQDDGRRKAAAAAAEKDDFNVPPANESLENPLVSLECFIFLCCSSRCEYVGFDRLAVGPIFNCEGQH